MKFLDWNVEISSTGWAEWMAALTLYHTSTAPAQAISRDYGVISGVIERINRKDPHWSCDCDGKGIVSNSSQNFSPDSVDSCCFLSSPHSNCEMQSHSTSPHVPDLPYNNVWNPEADPIIHRSSQTISSRAIREPSPWCPEADPIVESIKPTRTVGWAIGSAWNESAMAFDVPTKRRQATTSHKSIWCLQAGERLFSGNH